MGVAKKKQTISYRERKNYAQFFTEASLVKEIQNTFSLVFDNKSIVEPSCGEGVFIYELLKNNVVEIVGVDIDKKVLKKINKNNKLKLLNDDFLTASFSKKYDMVIGNPPFNLKAKNYNDSTEGFISKGIDILNEGGELILILPSTVLRNKCYQRIRHKILTQTRIIGILNTTKYEFLGADIETIALYLKKEIVSEQKYTYYNDNKSEKITLSINSRETILLNNTKVFKDVVSKIIGVKLIEIFEVKRGLNQIGLQGRMLDFYNDKHVMETKKQHCFIGIQNIAYRFTANAIIGDPKVVRDTITMLMPKKRIDIDKLRFIASFLNSSVAFYILHNNCLNNCRLTIHMDKYYIEDIVIPMPTSNDIKKIDVELFNSKQSLDYAAKRNVFFYNYLGLTEKEISEIEKIWSNPKFKYKEEVSSYESLQK